MFIPSLKQAWFVPKQKSPLRTEVDFFCDPVWIRTKDLLLRRQLLYPAELRDLYFYPAACLPKNNEGRSYMTIKKKGMIAHPQSGRQDSNLRPPGPKPGAMTGLRYAPNESSSSIFYAHQPLLTFYFFV